MEPQRGGERGTTPGLIGGEVGGEVGGEQIAGRDVGESLSPIALNLNPILAMATPAP